MHMGNIHMSTKTQACIHTYTKQIHTHNTYPSMVDLMLPIVQRTMGAKFSANCLEFASLEHKLALIEIMALIKY